MIDSTTKKLIHSISKNVIEKISPQELLLFQATSDAYFKNPQKTLKELKEKDEMIGFGPGESLTLLAPIVLAVTTEMVKFAIGILQEAAKDDLKDKVRENLFSKFSNRFFQNSNPTEHEISSLTNEQREQLRQVTFEKARQFNLPEDQAKQLSDCIVDNLPHNPEYLDD